MKLYCVPDDANCPTPVDFDRVQQVIEYLGTRMDRLDDNTAVAHFDGIAFFISFTSAGRFLSVRTVWNSQTPASDRALSILFSSADTWNRERYFPTIYTTIEEGLIVITIDYITDVDNGFNDDQLLDNISAAVATGAEALEYMHSVVQVAGQ